MTPAVLAFLPGLDWKAMLVPLTVLGQPVDLPAEADLAECPAAIVQAAEDDLVSARLWTENMVCEGGDCGGEGIQGGLEQASSDEAAQRLGRTEEMIAAMRAVPPTDENSVCMRLDVTEGADLLLDGTAVTPEGLVPAVNAKAGAPGIRYSRLVLRYGEVLSPKQVQELNALLLQSDVDQLTARP